MPIVVGGGVKKADLPQLKATGVDGFFVVSAVCSADDPLRRGQGARRYLAAGMAYAEQLLRSLTSSIAKKRIPVWTSIPGCAFRLRLHWETASHSEPQIPGCAFR